MALPRKPRSRKTRQTNKHAKRVSPVCFCHRPQSEKVTAIRIHNCRVIPETTEAYLSWNVKKSIPGNHEDRTCPEKKTTSPRIAAHKIVSARQPMKTVFVLLPDSNTSLKP